jgi:hypothetical protein
VPVHSGGYCWLDHEGKDLGEGTHPQTPADTKQSVIEGV